MKTNIATWAATAALISLLSACGSGGGSSNGTETPAEGDNGMQDGNSTVVTVLIDASISSEYAYFSLESGSVVTPEHPEDSAAWDMGFRRTAFILNGGASGTKGTLMAYTGNNSEFYDAAGNPIVSVFNAATAESELEDLTAADAESNATAWSGDTFSPAIVGDGSEAGWWLYNSATHQVSGNDDNYFLVRSGEQDNGKYAYARLRGKAFASSGDDRNITLGLSVQTSATQTGFTAEADEVFALTAANNMTLCYRFDTMAQNDCSGTWDIQVSKETYSYVIRTNGGASGSGSGAAFSLGSDPATYGSAGTALPADLSAINSQYWISDVMESDFGKYSATYGWGEYDLNGAHKIHPNYRVYLLDNGSKTYALQILSYYHPDTLTSGYITLRYREVE